MTARNTYVRSMSGWYWKNPYFLLYMLRELTAVLLAGYAVVLLAGLVSLSRGAETYANFLGFLTTPLSVVLHTLIFAASLYNTYTWFKVSPKATPPVYIGKSRIQDGVIIGAQYVLFIAVSIVLIFLARSV